MRVTHNMEDTLIEMYKGWAESEIKDSVCTNSNIDEDFFENNKIYDRAVALLTSFYYESRLAYSDVQYVQSPDGVLSAIQKLRGAYPYESE